MKYRLRNLFAVLALCLGADASALTVGTIMVHNTTNQELAVAPYHLTKKTPYKATRYDKGVVLKPDSEQKVARPSLTLRYDSELFCVPVAKKELLKKELNEKEINALFHINIGRMRGFNVYLYTADGGLLGASTSLSHDVVAGAQAVARFPITAAQKTAALAVKPLQYAIKQKQPAILKNPHAKDVATIRVGNELCAQERAYLAQRKPKVREALSRFMGTEIAQAEVPTIALVCSGGGYRAMLGTSGDLVGLEAIKLLDAVTYMVGLSGSTWAINYWTVTGGSAHDMRERLIKKVPRGIKKLSSLELHKLVDALLVKWAFNQQITLVDLYGGLLANVLFDEEGNSRQRVHLSSEAERIKEGAFIFPIYTSISGKEEKDRKWYEYTPYEIGGAWLGRYVPTWAYGRRFADGRSQDFAPEQSLGYLCGTFGSAFAVTFERIVKEMAGASLDTVLDSVAADLEKAYVPGIAISLMRLVVEKLFKTRISSARVFNFAAAMPGSPVRKQEKLSFVDAGLAFNLPYPPVSGERPERRADVIIFLDISATVKDAPELRKAEAYAREHSLPFPAINYDGIDTRAVSIFKDENNLAAPLVIYAPCAKDEKLVAGYLGKKTLHELVRRIEHFDVNACIQKSFCNTFNFEYKPEEARQLSTLTEFNIRASEQKIREALAWKIAQKKAQA